MRVEIASRLLAELRDLAARSPDQEICGVLFGTRQRIDSFEPARNLAFDPSRAFEIDPAALFSAHRAARQGGPMIVGHYHSHPRGAPTPSACDADMAIENGALWLILSCDGGHGLFVAKDGGTIHGRFDQCEMMLIN